MADTREIILVTSRLTNLSEDKLQKLPEEGGWNIAEVLYHLNFYSSFYLTEIEKALHRHQTSPTEYFRSGWLGNYFTNMIRPKSKTSVGKKIKSPKNSRPKQAVNGQEELKKFLTDQQHLLNLLAITKTASLHKIKVPISLTRWIKLNLGDTFRFFIAHEQRHMVQISKLLANGSVEK